MIEVHISRLRSKIDKGHKQALLHTVRGEGYVLRDDADHQCESLRNVVKKAASVPRLGTESTTSEENGKTLSSFGTLGTLGPEGGDGMGER